MAGARRRPSKGRLRRKLPPPDALVGRLLFMVLSGSLLLSLGIGVGLLLRLDHAGSSLGAGDPESSDAAEAGIASTQHLRGGGVRALQEATARPHPPFRIPALPKEENWRNYKLDDLYRHHHCDDVLEKDELPLRNESTWRLLRHTYEAVVGPVNSTIGDASADFDAFSVKHHEGQSKGMGRGIYADEFIPEGTLVYDFRRTAHFLDGDKYREFIMRFDDELACDVQEWSYIVDLNDEVDDDTVPYDNRVLVDLDEGCLCNDGEGEGNLGYAPVEAENGTAGRYNGMRPLFALRDIEAGEELLCNYHEFVQQAWDEFGLA